MLIKTSQLLRQRDILEEADNGSSHSQGHSETAADIGTIDVIWNGLQPPPEPFPPYALTDNYENVSSNYSCTTPYDTINNDVILLKSSSEDLKREKIHDRST